jgi:hypothetical protein
MQQGMMNLYWFYLILLYLKQHETTMQGNVRWALTLETWFSRCRKWDFQSVVSEGQSFVMPEWLWGSRLSGWLNTIKLSLCILWSIGGSICSWSCPLGNRWYADDSPAYLSQSIPISVPPLLQQHFPWAY